METNFEMDKELMDKVPHVHPVDYKEKYHQLLNNATAMLKYCDESKRDAIEQLFPELKRTECEVIKDEIINYFICQCLEEPSRKETLNKWIAWLEKTEANVTDDALYQKGYQHGLRSVPQEIDRQVWEIAHDAAITWEQSMAILMAADKAYKRGKAAGLIIEQTKQH